MAVESRYDEVSRYLGQKAGPKLIPWLMGVSKEKLPCDKLEDSSLVLPNLPERVCDLVAKMRDETQGGLPCAGIVEFQLTPDPLMFGRMLIAGGMVWVRRKPTPLPGDRYGLIGIVINLTGIGNCSHNTVVETAEWTFSPRELNLEEFDAEKVMDDVEAGKAPIEVMALIPLMKKGGDPDTMQRWLGIVSALTDMEMRGDCALARVYAGAVGLEQQWKTLVEKLTMIESPVVAEWMQQSEAKGRTKGKIDALQAFLARFGPLPADLTTKIQACTDPAQIDDWIMKAATAKSLKKFRKETNL